MSTPAAPATDEHSSDRVTPRPEPLRRPDTLAIAGELLRALAAPVRIAIVLQLRQSPRCVHELVEVLGVAQPLVSQHLRVLKAAGVVRGDRHGREVVYQLADEHLAHIVADAVAHAEEDSVGETGEATPIEADRVRVSRKAAEDSVGDPGEARKAQEVL